MTHLKIDIGLNFIALIVVKGGLKINDQPANTLDEPAALTSPQEIASPIR